MYDVDATTRVYVDYLGFNLDWPERESDQPVDMRHDVFAVKKGMTIRQVRRLAGRPMAVLPKHANGDCWLYHVDQKGTSIHDTRFCFARGHVSLIDTPPTAR